MPGYLLIDQGQFRPTAPIVCLLRLFVTVLPDGVVGHRRVPSWLLQTAAL